VAERLISVSLDRTERYGLSVRRMPRPVRIAGVRATISAPGE
jgi:hypothetical protein